MTTKTLKCVAGRKEAGMDKGIGLVEMFFLDMLRHQDDPNCNRVPDGVKLERVQGTKKELVR